MEDYYDPLAVSAIGGNVLSSMNNPRLGLYSPVNISQHATSPASAANIAKVGFQPGYPGWAGANKIYSSADPNVLKHYGTSKIGMVTPEGNRLPWGGGISKHGVNLSTAGESAMGIEKANKAREFYERLRSGRYANSPAAQRLLTTGKNYAGGLGNWLSKFKGAGSILGKLGMYPVFADVFAGPTDEGFRTTKAYVEPIKKVGNVIKNVIQGGGNQGGGQGGGGGYAAGQSASPVSQPSYTPTVHSGEASWQPTPSVDPKPPPQRDYESHVKSGAYGLRRGGIASLWRR